MTGEPRGPAGPEAPEARRPTDRAITDSTQPLARGAGAAWKFVGRVSQLDADAVRAAVQAWHEVMRSESDAWFAAERAAGHAVLATGRTAEQEVLLDRLAECVLRRVWYHGRGPPSQPPVTPERRVGATEASGQYTSTIAMLALLVRDCLAPAEFGLLYRPFAALVPLEELGRE